MIAIDRGIALAAGLGTRMRPLTNNRPKALVDVDGRALLDWALDRLFRAGVEEAVVNIHHFADLMRSHIDAHPDRSRINISDESDVVLETGGGVVKALPLLGETPFFVTNIDAIWRDEKPAELDRMRAAWDGEEMDVLLLLAPMDRTLGFDGAGDFFLDDSGQVSWRGDAETAPYAYAGTQIINPAVLKDWPVDRYSMTKVWRGLIERGRVTGLPMQRFWMHVGDPEAREQAEARLGG